MEEQNGKCLECGTPLHGRPDKKFCSIHCKNRYNARLRTKHRQAQNRIINILMCNYRILDSLLEKGKTSAPVDELACMGFVPSCITGYRKGRYNHEEYCCFDLRYYLSSSRIFNLHRTDYRSVLAGSEEER